MCPETIVKSCRPLSFAFLDAIFHQFVYSAGLSKVFWANRYISYEDVDFTAYLFAFSRSRSSYTYVFSVKKDPEILVVLSPTNCNPPSWKKSLFLQKQVPSWTSSQWSILILFVRTVFCHILDYFNRWSHQKWSVINQYIS